MTVGEKLKLEPAFHGAGGAPVPTEEQGVTWTSSDPDVVMVDVNGTIKALKEGTAAITVTTDVGQKTAVCNVTVGHSPVKTGGKEATCTEEGSREYYSCSSCGKFFEDEACTKEITDIDTWRVIAPLDHSFTNYVYNNDATCTADGTETAKCDRCDETDTREKAGTALGHKAVKTEAKAATCTSEGYTGDKVCKECGEVLEKGEVIPMLAHSYKEGTCTVCGALDPDYKPADPAGQNGSVNKDSNNPQSGDDSNIMLWILMLAVSGCAAGKIFVYNKKKRC